MALAFSTALRNARADAIDDAVNGDTPPAKLRIYSGTRPSPGGTPTTLLAELTMSATAFAAASGGVLTANAITGDTSADNTGTATWFRLVTGGASTFVMDGDVGTSGSDLNLTSTSIVATEGVDVTSFVLTEGNA